MKTLSYTLWSYDVVGNIDDGYEVNDRSVYDNDVQIDVEADVCNQGTDMEFTAYSPSKRQILDALIGVGYLRQDITEDQIEIDGDDVALHIDSARNGAPICGLELNE